MPKISIVIPVYKVGKYIENSMKSVCMQTYKDFEVLLVDNNTPDDSIEIAENVLNSNRIEYRVVKQTKQGLPAARNMGISVAKGEWVISIDPDDTIAPSFLETLYERALKCDTNIVFSNYGDVLEKHLFEFPESNSEIETVIYNREQALNMMLYRKLPLMVSNMFFRRAWFDDNKFQFDETIYLGADLALMWRLLLYADKIVCIKNQLYNHFVREDSLMTAPAIEKIDSNVKGYQRLQKEYSDNYSSEFGQWLYARGIYGHVRNCCIHSTYDFYMKIYKMYYTKEVYKWLLDFPDWKIRVTNKILWYSPKTFFGINQLFKNPDSLVWRTIVGRLHKR